MATELGFLTKEDPLLMGTIVATVPVSESDLPVIFLGIQHNSSIQDKGVRQIIKKLLETYKIVSRARKDYYYSQCSRHPRFLSLYKTDYQTNKGYVTYTNNELNQRIMDEYHPTEGVLIINDITKPIAESHMVKLVKAAGLPLHIYITNHGWVQ